VTTKSAQRFPVHTVEISPDSDSCFSYRKTSVLQKEPSMRIFKQLSAARTLTSPTQITRGSIQRHPRRSSRSVAIAITSASCLVIAAVLGDAAIASAAQPKVQLGTATSFAVLAGSTVTNTGPSSIEGSLGLAPGTAVTGFPPGLVSNGSTYAANAVALQAKSDLTTGYLDAAGRTPFVVAGSDLGGTTLAPGVYRGSSSLGLTGTLTLNGQGDASAVFIFQAGSTLITASSSTVVLENGAQACNVFWQVGSSATLGSYSNFIGTIMALTSATLNTGVTVHGRVLARNGAVTLQNDTIVPPTCAAAPVTTPPTKKHPKAPPTKKHPAKKPTPTPVAKKPVAPVTPPSNGSPPASPGSTGTTPSGKIPLGAPQTGLGGTTHGANAAELGGGLMALLGALVVGGVASRRRRSLWFRSLQGDETDGSG
jgi:hypothetical protein